MPYMLPLIPFVLPWALIMGNCGTSANNKAFVLTTSGSCRLHFVAFEFAHACACARERSSARAPAGQSLMSDIGNFTSQDLYIYIYIHDIHTYIYIYIIWTCCYVCVYVCIYIYIYIYIVFVCAVVARPRTAARPAPRSARASGAAASWRKFRQQPKNDNESSNSLIQPRGDCIAP